LGAHLQRAVGVEGAGGIEEKAAASGVLPRAVGAVLHPSHLPFMQHSGYKPLRRTLPRGRFRVLTFNTSSGKMGRLGGVRCLKRRACPLLKGSQGPGANG
jgi:hypothetical protein